MSDFSLASSYQINANSQSSYIYNQSDASNFSEFIEEIDLFRPTMRTDRNYDYIEPDALVLHLHDNSVNINELKHQFGRISFTVNISDVDILKIPLKLLMDLSEPVLLENKMYINLPLNYLIGEIKMLYLPYTAVVYKIDNYINLANYILKYSIVLKKRQIDVREKINLMEILNVQDDIQQIYSNFIQISEPKLEFINYIHFQNFVKGIFIQVPVDKLVELKFYINGLLRIDYNLFYINRYCTKISDNLIYVPFVQGVDYKNKSINSYDGSINFSAINQPIILLKFSEPQTNVNIYGISRNVLVYRGGMDITHFDNENHCQIINTTLNRSYIRQERTNTNNITNQNNITTQNNESTNEYNGSIFHNYPLSDYSEYKLIENDNICQITMDVIEKNHIYMQCIKCHKNFNNYVIRRWLNASPENNCPCCRRKWVNYTMYINNVNYLTHIS